MANQGLTQHAAAKACLRTHGCEVAAFRLLKKKNRTTAVRRTVSHRLQLMIYSQSHETPVLHFNTRHFFMGLNMPLQW